ncbi:MAG: BatA domain-containing protein [Gemmatimonadota bacterium]|nr:BatA domain-containing protein [Gemmatimonadota bacterium]
MIFLAPVYLIAAGAVAAGVVALHFLSTREPDTDLLPTTRFIPKVPVQATTITVRFTDPWLLVLRVLLILLLGAALARPLIHPLSAPVARIAVVDVSRAVGSARELADSARGYVEGAAAVVFFDREAREVGGGAMDSLDALAEGTPVPVVGGAGQTVDSPGVPADEETRDSPEGGPAGDGTGTRGAASEGPRRTRAEKGSLSSALIAALRTASRLRDGADSLQLVVISPFAREERDAATERIRALWPGRIEVVRVGGVGPADGLPTGARTALADPVPTGTATESPGQSPRVRVEWADSTASEFWTERETPDTIAGVRAADAVMVYPFERRWRPATVTPSALSAADPTPGPAENTLVYARWMDGEPAAFERATEDGCLRSIAIPLPTEGDAILRPAFQRFLAGLDAPCGEPGDPTPLSDAFLTAFAGDGPLAPASEIGRQVKRVTPAVPWILALALLVALAEHWARRRLAKGSDTGPASGRQQVQRKRRAA